ncbi:MAG: hypothetical protein HWN68_13955 [Desulfobacterales bacterium]|nr:hypothetical protein [Desulfobacterales bacterium]
MKKYYLIYDYGNKIKNEPQIREVDEDELWKIVQNAVDKLPKIAVYRIGDCIFDWS